MTIKEIGARENLRIKYGDYRNVKDSLDDLFRDYGHRTAVKYMIGDEVIEVSSDRFFADIKETAAELFRMGLYRKHIGIIGKNSYEWLVVSFAAMYAGTIYVPMSRAFHTEDIIYHSDFADVDVMFYDEELSSSLKQFSGQTGKKAYDMKKFIAGEYREDRITEDGTIDNRTDKKDLACILFTSGTTGKSKGVMITNEAFCIILKCWLYDLYSMQVVLPLHHVAGLTVAQAVLGCGGELHIGEDPKQIIKYLYKMKSDATLLVPALMNAICARLKKADYDQEKLGWKLRYLGCCGATFPSGVIPLINSAGIDIEQYYGQTETSGGAISGLMTEDNPSTIGSFVTWYSQADTIDGELVFKGPRVFSGYYKDEEATKEVFIDGWYHTGDLARKDEDGNWYLTGRKKNLIILDNGENISPEEIEAKFGACQDINEVLIYGKGSFLHAEILPVLSDNPSSEEKEAVQTRIRDFANTYNETAPLYKRVPFVEFRYTPFEKNDTGKIMRIHK